MSAPSVAQSQAADFRAFFRNHPAGVVVITASTDEGPVGFTAGSLVSVSAEPPIVSFNVSHRSSSWTALSVSTHIAVHLVTVAHAELAALFARSGVQRFENAQWDEGPYGLPLLREPVARLICSVRNRVEAGDSSVVIAEVLQIHQDEATSQPLAWVTGRFAQVLPLDEPG